MAEQIEVTGITLIAHCSDGNLRQVRVSKEEQDMWLCVMGKFYNPLKVISKPLETLQLIKQNP